MDPNICSLRVSVTEDFGACIRHLLGKRQGFHDRFFAAFNSTLNPLDNQHPEPTTERRPSSFFNISRTTLSMPTAPAEGQSAPARYVQVTQQRLPN
jgi:hypothetical protein